MSEITQSERGAEQVERIAPGQDPIKVIERWFDDTSSKKWENIQPGETKVFVFVLDKTERIVRKFPDRNDPTKTLEKKMFRFTVINEDGAEKTIDFSPRWAQTIVSFLKEGYQRIKVSRKGAGTDTEYTFVPLQH